MNLHEDLSRHQTVEGSSDRSFGLVFAGALTVLALAPLRHRQPLRPWALVGGGAFLVLALAAPRLLAPLNKVWLRLGVALGRVVTPVTLGVMFFVVFTPLGWLMRATGRNLLGLRRDPAARSYWTARAGGEGLGAAMSRQF